VRLGERSADVELRKMKAFIVCGERVTVEFRHLYGDRCRVARRQVLSVDLKRSRFTVRWCGDWLELRLDEVDAIDYHRGYEVREVEVDEPPAPGV